MKRLSALALLVCLSASATDSDYKIAMEGANNGDAASQLILAQMYRNGANGVSRSVPEAIKWYERSANQDDEQAIVELALIYLNDGEYKNIGKAVKWLKILSSKGFIEAQHTLGSLYQNGDGVVKNYKEAFKWYMKAAENGYADSQIQISLLHFYGNGVDKNLKEAFMWAKKSAIQGNVQAQNNVGAAYYHGEGVAKNLVKSYMWSLIAKSNNYDDGSNKVVNALEGMLSKEHQIKAQEMAEKCVSSNYKECD